MTGAWRCTDVGTRTVIAIKLGPREITHCEIDHNGNRQMSTIIDDDPSCLDGPPYAVAESIFDEYDIEACYPTQAELLAEQPASIQDHDDSWPT